MRKKQSSSAFQLDDAQVVKLKRLLHCRKIDAYHKAGDELNRVFKGSSSHGSKAMESVARQLGSSPNMLHKVRLLAHLWSRDDVDAAIDRRMPWHVVIQTMFLDGLARRLPKARRPSVIKARRKLVRLYPMKRSGIPTWQKEFARVKARFLSGLSCGSKARQLSEVRQAVAYRLNGALDRMAAGQVLLPEATLGKAEQLHARLRGLRDEFEVLFASATKELRDSED